MSIDRTIKQLAREQYKVLLGEFILFSSASELLIWLCSEMTPFELEHLAYQLGNTDVTELQKSGCDTPAEAYVFEHDFVFVLQDKAVRLFVYSCDFIDVHDDHLCALESTCK